MAPLIFFVFILQSYQKLCTDECFFNFCVKKLKCLWESQNLISDKTGEETTPLISLDFLEMTNESFGIGKTYVSDSTLRVAIAVKYRRMFGVSTGSKGGTHRKNLISIKFF